MLTHNFHKPHTTTRTLLLHNPFLSAEGNAASFLSIPHKNSLSTKNKQQQKILLRRASTAVKAVLTSTEKSTTVKAVITVLQTVGGALTHLGLSRGLDDIADVLGRTLLVELVAAELDAKSEEEKPTIKAFARKTGNHENETYYESSFEIPEDFGEIGAVLVENEHHQEMFVKDIVFDGFSTGSLHINCESWIHPKSVNPEKRVFFSNKGVGLAEALGCVRLNNLNT